MRSRFIIIVVDNLQLCKCVCFNKQCDSNVRHLPEIPHYFNDGVKQNKLARHLVDMPRNMCHFVFTDRWQMTCGIMVRGYTTDED